MPLRFGLPLTLLGLAALTALSYLIAIDLYWPTAALAGLLAARDAARLDARRYDSMFPLEPAGTFLAVTLALPCALPWYLRLRHRIRIGQLAQRTQPRSYVPGVVLLTAAILGVGWLVIRPPRLLREVSEAQVAVQERVARPFTLTLTGSNATVVFPNVLLGDSAEARADLANHAADAVRLYFRDKRTLAAVRVNFTRVIKRGMVTSTQIEDAFTWTSGQLLEETLPEPASRTAASGNR